MGKNIHQFIANECVRFTSSVLVLANDGDDNNTNGDNSNWSSPSAMQLAAVVEFKIPSKHSLSWATLLVNATLERA